MSSTSDNAPATPSKPIPIAQRRRRRASSSSDSATESDSPVDSAGDDNSPPRVVIRTPPSVSPVRISPSTSPILSYFFPTSPTAKSPLAVGKTVLGYPTVVVEDEETAEPDIPSAAHARRLSNTWSGPRLPVTTPGGDDRGAGLLRRLSLGAAFAKSPPQGAGAAPALPTLPQRSQAPQPPASPSARTRRSHTLAAPPQTRPRAPSPMGERILKGHFDGFN